MVGRRKIPAPGEIARLMLPAAGMLVALCAATAAVVAAGYGFSGASDDWELAAVAILLGLIAMGIALAPGPPPHASAGLGVGRHQLRIPGGVAPAMAAVALVVLWFEPRPWLPLPDEDRSLTMIVREEQLRRPLVAGTPPVHQRLWVAPRDPDLSFQVKPDWASIALPPGFFEEGIRTFAPVEPPDSALTTWITVDETLWPLRVPPDRLEVDQTTPEAEIDRLRREYDPAAGAMTIVRDERGLRLGWLAPATRPASPWRFGTLSEGFSVSSGKSWVGGSEGWYRSAPRDHYVAGYFVSEKQKPAVSPAWDWSDPPLAFGVLGHRVPYRLNPGLFMTEVHVLSPLVGIASREGLPEPYLVRVDKPNWPKVQPDVLPDREAPRQGRDLLDDLLRSRRSRLDAAAPGFLVPDQPTAERPTRAYELVTARRLPASPSMVDRLQGDVVRVGLVAACGALLLASLWAWGRRLGT